MLSDAIRDIDQAVRLDRAERAQRREMRASSDRADGYMWQIEEILEDGTGQVPDPLVIEIARFVRPYSRRLACLLARDPAHNPVQVLDVLFEVQERIQRRTMAEPEVTEALAS